MRKVAWVRVASDCDFGSGSHLTVMFGDSRQGDEAGQRDPKDLRHRVRGLAVGYSLTLPVYCS